MIIINCKSYGADDNKAISLFRSDESRDSFLNIRYVLEIMSVEQTKLVEDDILYEMIGHSFKLSSVDIS